MGRIFAVPDIHGRADLLARLMTRLDAEAALDLNTDHLVFLGDMIDRGPNSAGVVKIIQLTQAAHPDHVIVLGGNHEWLAIDAVTNPTLDNRYLWDVNGGGRTLRSFGPDGIPDETVKWMAALPLSFEKDGFFFSHAPVPAERYRLKSNQGQPFTKEELIWTYGPDEEDIARDMRPTTIGVCGHIHQLQRGIKEPRFYGHYYFLDAGCGCSPFAPLCAVEVKSKTVFTVHPFNDRPIEVAA